MARRSFLPTALLVAVAVFTAAATVIRSPAASAQDAAYRDVTGPAPILPAADEMPFDAGDEDPAGPDVDLPQDRNAGEEALLDPEPDFLTDSDIAADSRPDAAADSDPELDAVSGTAAIKLSADGRFVECPDQLLKEAWASILSETALDTFAVDEEVLRNCERRQALIKRILRQEAEMGVLLQKLPPGRPVTSTVPTEPAVTLAASPVADLADAAPATPDFPAPIVGPAHTAIAAAAAPFSGHWTHLVRYRVRVGEGKWRAGVASIYTPPPLPPITNEDGTVIPGPPPQPDPPLVSIVAAGDALPDGLIVARIGAEDVLVRDAQAANGSDTARPLRNDPGPSEPTLTQASCPTGAADARDFIHCKVQPGVQPGVQQ